MTRALRDPARDEVHLVRIEVEGDAKHRLLLRCVGEPLDPHRESGFSPRLLLRVTAVDEDVRRDARDGLVVEGLHGPGETGGRGSLETDEGPNELVVLFLRHLGLTLLEDEHELPRLPLAVVLLHVGAVELEAHPTK